MTLPIQGLFVCFCRRIVSQPIFRLKGCKTKSVHLQENIPHKLLAACLMRGQWKNLLSTQAKKNIHKRLSTHLLPKPQHRVPTNQRRKWLFCTNHISGYWMGGARRLRCVWRTFNVQQEWRHTGDTTFNSDSNDKVTRRSILLLENIDILKQIWYCCIYFAVFLCTFKGRGWCTVAVILVFTQRRFKTLSALINNRAADTWVKRCTIMKKVKSAETWICL